MLEHLYDPAISDSYHFEIKEGVVLYKKLFLEMIQDETPSLIASKFINGLAELAIDMGKKYRLPLVLSGGVFQNRTLLEKILSLQSDDVYFPHQLPPNDGGICVGQLSYALHL